MSLSRKEAVDNHEKEFGSNHARGIHARMGKLKEVFSALTVKERVQIIAILEKVSKKNR